MSPILSQVSNVKSGGGKNLSERLNFVRFLLGFSRRYCRYQYLLMRTISTIARKKILKWTLTERKNSSRYADSGPAGTS